MIDTFSYTNVIGGTFQNNFLAACTFHAVGDTEHASRAHPAWPLSYCTTNNWRYSYQNPPVGTDFPSYRNVPPSRTSHLDCAATYNCYKILSYTYTRTYAICLLLREARSRTASWLDNGPILISALSHNSEGQNIHFHCTSNAWGWLQPRPYRVAATWRQLQFLNHPKDVDTSEWRRDRQRNLFVHRVIQDCGDTHTTTGHLSWSVIHRYWLCFTSFLCSAHDFFPEFLLNLLRNDATNYGPRNILKTAWIILKKCCVALAVIKQTHENPV